MDQKKLPKVKLIAALLGTAFLVIGSKKIFASPPSVTLSAAPEPLVLGAQISQTPVVAITPPPPGAPAPTHAPAPAQNFVTISGTPTGYLNVRDQPSLGGNVIGKVNPGQTYPYAQKQGGWYLIKLKDGHHGWIDGQYTVSGSKKTISTVNGHDDSE